MIIGKKILVALLTHASKDTTRTAMCGLLVHLEKRYLVATDGHRAGFVSLGKATIAELSRDPHVTEGGVCISRATFAAALTGAGKELEIRPDVVMGGVPVAYAPGPWRDYPPAFRAFAAERGTEREDYRINAGYLSDALALCALEGGLGQVEISSRGDLDPVLISSIPGKIAAIIMPCRT